MADRVLFISWGENVAGREERGLEVFNEAVGLYGKMQQDGRIESFDVKLLDATGDISGCMELYGSAAQLDAVREDKEFRSMLIDASLVVEQLHVATGMCNEGIAEGMTMYQEALSRVGTPA